MASQAQRPASRTTRASNGVMSTDSNGLRVSMVRTRRATIAALAVVGTARLPRNANAEHVVPRHAGGHLHQGEERHDGAHRDREAREALEEEGVAEEHQENRLGHSCLE